MRTTTAVKSASLVGQSVESFRWRTGGRPRQRDLIDCATGRVWLRSLQPDAGDAFRTAEKVRNEYVLRVKGVLRKRTGGQQQC